MALSTYDPLRTVEDLTDPSAAEFLAAQMNDGQLNQNVANGAPTIKDLTDTIIDLTYETTAQGASILEAHITDPYWTLLTRYGTQPAFIDVDDAGLLIAVDVNFPTGTDSWWRLQAAEPSTVIDGPNLVLTFEDRIVVQLRDLGGPRSSAPGQTRAQFIASLVRQVPNIRFMCPALKNPPAGTQNPLVLGTPPARHPASPPARTNPGKNPGIGQPGHRENGAVWTSSGWRYTKPMNGFTVAELNALNPPTNTLDRVP